MIRIIGLGFNCIERFNNNMAETQYSYESELVANIVKGSNVAEKELVEKYNDGLRSLLATRCQDDQTVDDVLQESWMVILRKLRAGDLKDSRRLSGFVTQVTRNQLLMTFRRQNTGHELADDLDQQAQQSFSGPMTFLENKQLGQVLAKLLEGMSKSRDRELLLQFYYYGETKNTLCNNYKLSPASFDAILSRARNRFKKTWNNLE